MDGHKMLLTEQSRNRTFSLCVAKDFTLYMFYNENVRTDKSKMMAFPQGGTKDRSGRFITTTRHKGTSGGRGSTDPIFYSNVKRLVITLNPLFSVWPSKVAGIKKKLSPPVDTPKMNDKSNDTSDYFDINFLSQSFGIVSRYSTIISIITENRKLGDIERLPNPSVDIRRQSPEQMSISCLLKVRDPIRKIENTKQAQRSHIVEYNKTNIFTLWTE